MMVIFAILMIMAGQHIRVEALCEPVFRIYQRLVGSIDAEYGIYICSSLAHMGLMMVILAFVLIMVGQHIRVEDLFESVFRIYQT